MTSAVGLGMDINALVAQLVEAEGAAPKARLNRREAVLNYQLSALGQLKSALSSFRSGLSNLLKPENFQQRSASSSHPELFTVSAGNQAVAGKHDIEVVRLAKAHKMISDGFESKDAVVGSGTLTLKVGEASVDIEINDSNNTLAGIRDAINAAEISPKVSATIVNVDEGEGTVAKLVLTSGATGEAHALELSVSEDAEAPGLARLAQSNFTDIDAAQDAVIRVDGQTVTRGSNTISDAIEGVTLTLLKAEEGTTATASIQLDRAAAKKNVTAFVENYNKLVSSLRQLTQYDAEKDDAGPLNGDSTVRAITSQLQRELSTVAPDIASGFRTLADIGITTERDGTLKIDQAKLDKAFDANYNQIGELFAGEGGLAVRLDRMFEELLSSKGVLESRISGMQDRSKGIAKERERLELRLEQVERRYRAQFVALDSLLVQLQSTSSYLTQQLQNLQKLTPQ